jgi:hypothetical protein
MSLNELVLKESIERAVIQKKGKSLEISRLNVNVDALFSKLKNPRGCGILRRWSRHGN